MSDEIERLREQLHLANIDAFNLQAELTAANEVVEAARTVHAIHTAITGHDDGKCSCWACVALRAYDAAKGSL